MFDKIEIKTVNWKNRNIKDINVFETVDVTLRMHSKTWATLQKMIETSHIFNKRKHDNPDGNVNTSANVFEKILDIGKLLETSYFKFQSDITCKKDEFIIEVGSYHFKGTLPMLMNELKKIENDIGEKA